ncbi:YecH family metal-binding protein [Vibrio hippocampi]|uniref:DUF2492 domain-containing protein n=1 Tax=Vibrio hippocampi TaxID=654686 RepID=A0ABM8ZKM2_9VIBR|nr:YecH family metal-binding protein [Vibrio hippocampi]CAH0527359.1 hypothetical protein VHP8226_02669 [Vibrio hippocampi]
MSTNVHAHKVLNLLKQQPMTRESLVAEVKEQFGEEVSFHTCSREGFDLDSLFSFFVQNQKVVEKEGVWHLNLERVCSH